MAVKSEAMSYLNIRAEAAMIRKLQKLAEADRRTLSNYVRLILAEHIEKQNGGKP